MREVVLHCGGSSPHLSHIMSGFALLRAAGEVSVRFLRTDRYEPGAKADATISAVVDGRHRLVFELRDGSDLAVAELNWSSFYFKRSYSRIDHGGDSRIVPLGLNYPVTASGDWRLRRAVYSLLASRRGTLAAGFSTAVGLGGPSGLSRRLGVEPWSASKVDVIEDEGGRLDPPKVLLLTRVWDHRKMSGAKAEQWERLNGLRAACIRALSVEFGPQFVGGLAPTPSALRDFPDLVVDASTTRRSAYLGTMKSSRVCVATAGLRDSNGFRLAEYTAASRAIVSEPLSFEVPGPFGAGTHYLPFLFGGVFRGSTIGFVKKERLFLIGRVLRHPLVLSRSVGWKRVGLGVRLLLRRRVPPQAEAPAQVPSRSFGVLAIAVDPGTQGRGVGRLLMAEASERALAQGFRSMHLTVHPGNEQALRFYRDLGWTEVAEPSGEWRGRMRIALEPDSGEPGSTG